MIISSKDNIYIRKYLKLKNSKKTRIKENMFVIEGVRLIFEAIKQKAKLSSIFITKKCIKNHKNTGYDLSKLPQIKVITEEIAVFLSSTEHNQGVFAIVTCFKNFNITDITKKENCLALFKISDPGNMGTLIRTAFSFGILKIILYNCCDIYNPKTIRSTMGAIFGVKFNFCSNFEEAIAILNKNCINTYASVVYDCGKYASNLKLCKGVLILGGEAEGLPKKIIEASKEKVTIKMFQKAESLNVAIAGSILMYELTKSIYI